MELRHSIAGWLRDLQDEICAGLEQLDGRQKFITEEWIRPEGGGGRSRIITGGDLIEKGGVLYSAVEGEAPAFLFTEKDHSVADPLTKERPQFFATGVSIVLHPVNPWAPIIHMNIRYFEMSSGVRWLGGGIDATPHYVFENDARTFHRMLKEVCDRHHPDYYDRFSKWADDYFFIGHRKETRGIGGIFFDRLNETAEMSFDKNLSFWKDVGKCFVKAYEGLTAGTRSRPYTQRERSWQLLRRGRYVEFNLVYDKGTKFGLETNGRVESILMSLPPLAGWEYDHKPEPGSAEASTLQFLKKGIRWI